MSDDDGQNVWQRVANLVSAQALRNAAEDLKSYPPGTPDGVDLAIDYLKSRAAELEAANE